MNRNEERILTEYRNHLINGEKSAATVEKYLRDARAFLLFLSGRELSKKVVMAYKEKLSQEYAVRSVNSMLIAVNSLLSFLGRGDCQVKTNKLQRRAYCPEEKELTKAEYLRLCRAAEHQPRLLLVLQTICGTGIRVSELRYFTVDAVKRGEITVSCKNKTRTILLPGKLKKLLLRYAKQCGIAKGIILRTRTGRPLDRSNIWSDMKKLCHAAEVDPRKVFPHNLRKLFARTFYGIEKDIAKLADLLGHSSIDTTRIYIMTTGAEHRRHIERLGLVVWQRK